MRPRIAPAMLLAVGGGVVAGLSWALSTERGRAGANLIQYTADTIMAGKEYLSAHFTREEFERSATAIRYGIPNRMGPAELANARAMAALLEQLRTGLGGVPIKITSGYRGRDVNARIPGASNTSAHTSAAAVDIVVDGMTSEELGAAWIGLKIPFGELFWYTSDHHLHVTIPGVGGNGEVGHKVGEGSRDIVWTPPRPELWTGPRLAGVPQADSWQWGVVMCVAEEGEQSEPGEVNPNTDGQGVSYDLIQATQKSGELGKLLRRASTSFPTQFAAAFGPNWRKVVDVCERGSLEPVDGAVLWSEPWIGRFRRAGPLDWMRVAVRGYILNGFHWKQAIEAARVLNATTQRSFAAIFDRAVPRPGSVVTSAREVMQDHADEDETQRVAWFVGRELGKVSAKYRDAHTARYKRIMDSSKVSDAVVVDWSIGVV